MTDTPTPPALVDMQDPLPESNWLWRRVLTFVAIVFIFALMTGLGYAVHRIVGGVIERIDGMSAPAVADITIRALGVIERMFGWMYWSLLVVVTYYMVAPSAEQIAKMISAVALLKGGVQTGRRTMVREPGRTVETTTGTGTAVEPAVAAVERDSEAEPPETPPEPAEPSWTRT
jgi:hypothetical protein